MVIIVVSALLSALVVYAKPEPQLGSLDTAQQGFPVQHHEQWPGSKFDIGLTTQEKVWLAEQPDIVLGATTEYPPLLFQRADGTYDGMLIDVYDALNRRLDGKLRLHIGNRWSQVQQQAATGEIDGLALGGRTASREHRFSATNTLFSTYFSVFARSPDAVAVRHFQDLDGLQIGYKKGAGATRDLLAKLPSATLSAYPSHEAMTQALLSKEIDIIVAWISYDFWRKERLQGTIDNILLLHEHPMEMVVHVRIDRPRLIPILNKAIASLQKHELPGINNKWFGQWSSLNKLSRLNLSATEQAWIDQCSMVRVRVGDDPPWHINRPEPGGMVIDYLDIIGDMTGIDFRFISDNGPWIDAFRDVAGGHRRFDLVPTASQRPEPLETVAVSDAYLSSPWVIFTQDKTADIFGVQDLRGKQVAIMRGDPINSELEALQDDITFVTVDNTEAAVKAVSSGMADAHVGDLLSTTHLLQRAGINNVKVASPTPFGDHELALAVRQDWAPLIAIINKALASISEEEKSAIRSRYMSIQYSQGIDKAKALAWLLIIAAVTLSVVLVFVFWNRRLASETNKRKDAEQKLLTTFDKMPVAACMVDNQGNMYYHNHRFVELFGYSAEEITILDDWWQRAYPDQKYREWVIETWNECVRRSEETGGIIEAREYRVTCKNGQTRDMEISGISFGERYLATLIDNTERNQTKEALRAAKDAAEAASQAKSQFLANMSHELRTPLNAILGFSSLLSRDSAISVRQKEKLDMICRSGEHLLSMINDILDLSKIEAGRLDLHESTFDLKSLLAEINDMFQTRAAEKGLTLRLHTQGVDSSLLHADVGKLRQILLNLLDNAVKFTNEGGVTLRCTTEALDNRSRQCWILVEVADTGPGVASPARERIFEPFIQDISLSESTGSGLGLAICNKLIGLMRGSLELDSEKDTGAYFRVRFPATLVARDQVTSALNRPRVIGLAPGQAIPRILVVDDNLENRLMLSILLNQTGFDVCEAENGEQALQVFEQESPDFIWMDMRMQVMNGYQAVRRIRRQPGGGTLPIVALTASALREQRAAILAVGCDEIVVKPYQEGQIFDVMARFLDLEYMVEDCTPDAASSDHAESLTAAMLADVSTGLLRELGEATLMLDMHATLDVIRRIETETATTGRHLLALAGEFQLDRIQDLLQEVESDASYPSKSSVMQFDEHLMI